MSHSDPAAPPASAPSIPSFSTFPQRLGCLWRSPRLRLTGAILVAGIVLFGLLGYFWLPGFAQHKAEQALSELLARPVSVGRIEISPYRLEATVHELRIGEREGQGENKNKSEGKGEGNVPLAGFSRLVVNVSGASLWRRALVLDALRLEQPYANLVRHADGRTNLSDLVEKFAATDEAPTPTPQFAINNLEILGGRVTLDDRVSRSRHEIADFNLGLPRLASFPGEVERQVQPHFSATLDGAAINGAGEARPFAGEPDGHMKLRVADLDLARLAAFSPVPLPVRLEAARLDADLAVGFSTAGGEQIAVRGDVALRRLVATVPSAASARLDGARFALDAPDVFHAPIRLSAVRVDGLAVQRPDEAKPFLGLASAELDALSLDSARHALTLGNLALDRFDFRLARTEAGGLDIEDTLARVQAAFAPQRPGRRAAQATAASAPPSANPPSATPPSATPASATPAPLDWRIAGLRLDGAELSFVDRTVNKAVPLRLHELQLRLGELTASPATPVALDLKSRINDKGRLAVAGQLRPLAPAGELELTLGDLDLVPLQGWIPHRLKLALTKGALSAKGRLGFGGEPFGVRYRGEGRVVDFSLLDKDSAQSLLRWRTLALGGIDLDTAPLRVKLDDVALSRFFARLMITPQGQLNLDQLFGKEPPAPTASAGAEGAAAAARSGKGAVPPAPTLAAAPSAAVANVAPGSPGAPAAPLPVSIGRIRLDDGAVRFNDLFIKPNYNANLTGLSGRIGPLAAGKRGRLDIEGKVDGSAPLTIAGELEPFSAELFLDLTARARGIDMPAFSPYSGRYVGYAIQKGKLSVDVSYRIEKGQLQANNHIFLDQLTLGDPVDSPDALSIPIKLGLALLKNSRGEIDIDLPIGGSLNDPQFSIGGIVFKAIVNLLVKAVTSPFTLLGSLFGGGEELSYIDFASGLATLTPEAEKRLQGLAKALTERPALTLEVTGMADADADAAGYRRTLLERQVKARKVAADVAQGKSAERAGELSLTPEEYEKYLTQVYKDAKFEKPKNLIGFAKSLPVAEMENLLLAHIAVDAAGAGGAADGKGLAELAARRGKLVRDWLVAQGKVPAERVFVMAAEVRKGDPAAPGNRVAFSLR